MDLEKVRELISSSDVMEELNEYSVSITFPSTEETYDFTGLFNVYKFIKKQKDKWDEKEASQIQGLGQSKSFFERALVQLVSLIKNAKKNSLVKSNIKSHLNNLKPHLTPNGQIFVADAPEVDFLLRLQQHSPHAVASAFVYLTGGGINFNNKNNLQGALLAYEFQNKDISHIFNRRETEKKSLYAIRRKIDHTVNEYENTLIAHIKKTTQDYETYKEKLDDFEVRSEDSLSQWMITHKGGFEEFHKESIDKISALENQYAELLKLKEPVEYWKEKAKGLRNTGFWILAGVVVSTLVLAYFVYRLLWYTPEGLLESFFDGDRTSAIRWTIVFVIFISLFFVIIRSLSKFMFSNFHLARDAEEREKLTYLYLSLISTGEFNEEERKIVLQSLFSRSDTGLLKEDSSPTMPGSSSLLEKFSK